jgi:hypothetical protein
MTESQPKPNAFSRPKPAAPTSQPAELRLNEYTTIRAKQTTSPCYGTTSWWAHEHINGRRVGMGWQADTAEAAIATMEELIRERWAREADMEEMEASGMFADLTGVRVRGMAHQLNGIAPSHARTGECHFCGLASSTCDCR